MIILDESERLLAYFDEKTMERKEINIWNFFDELLKHSSKMLLMDGDISKRSLSFASSYGEMTYISNTNTESKKHFNLMLDETQWHTQLVADLNKFTRRTRPSVSASSLKAPPGRSRLRPSFRETSLT